MSHDFLILISRNKIGLEVSEIINLFLVLGLNLL